MAEDSDNDPGSFSDVRYTQTDGIAEVVIERAQKGNTLRPDTLGELDASRELAEESADVGVLVLRSQGDQFFCTGADLAAVQPVLEAGNSDAVSEFNSRWHEVYGRIENADIPVVAGVSGMALAGGLELLLVCDLVVAGPGASFGDHHVKYNLIGGGGATQRLPRIVGPRRAKQLLLTDKTISATTAREWGLINEVIDEEDDLAEEVRAYAADIAQHHPLALKRQKYLANQSMRTTLSEGLALEREMANVHLLSNAAGDGLSEFLDG